MSKEMMICSHWEACDEYFCIRHKPHICGKDGDGTLCKPADWKQEKCNDACIPYIPEQEHECTNEAAQEICLHFEPSQENCEGCTAWQPKKPTCPECVAPIDGGCLMECTGAEGCTLDCFHRITPHPEGIGFCSRPCRGHTCKPWHPQTPADLQLSACPICNGTGINPEKFPDARCPCTHTPADLQPERQVSRDYDTIEPEPEMPLIDTIRIVCGKLRDECPFNNCGNCHACDAMRIDINKLNEKWLPAHDSAVTAKLQRLEIFHTDVLAGCDIDKGKQGLYRQKRVIIGPGKTQDELDLETAKEELKGTASKARAKFAEEVRKGILEMATYGGNNPISIAYNRAIGRCDDIVRAMAEGKE